jgi:very-short-patch-repair endonuclease
MSRAAKVPRELRFGPFVGRDAVDAGLLTKRQLSGPAWCRLLPGIYGWRGLQLTHRDRCLAAGMYLDGRGAISGRDAAALWGADVLVRGAPIEVTVPLETRLRAPRGLRVVRSALPAGDVTSWAGTPTTTPGRTAFDLARRMSLVEAVVCIDAMLAARLVAMEDLERSARARPGWPGLPQLGKVLLLCDGKAESPQESRLRLILIAGGLPRPVAQYEVRTPSGMFVARLDLAYPQHLLGIEYDGDHHRGRGAYRSDLRRINNLRTCGWTVLRFVAANLWEPARIVHTVRSALSGGAD